MENYTRNRKLLKSIFNEKVESDQARKIEQPPLEKPYDKSGQIIDLPGVDRDILTKTEIFDCILDRKSNRVYKQEAMTLEELSFLLMMTQGIKEIKGGGYIGYRPVPSAGGRHPFETYLAVNNVDGLEKGIYRYLPIEHNLLFIREIEEISGILIEAANKQKFVGDAAVTFIWSCIPYRAEWRYAHKAYKVMLLDAGHICQALYLACETIGFGTCAIAAYNQESMDYLIEVDGKDEFVVYMAPVGRV